MTINPTATTGEEEIEKILTDRLEILKAAPGDAPVIFSLWTDPRVMENVGFPRGLEIKLAEIRERIEDETDEPTLLDTLLVARRRSDAVIIGQCMMHRPDSKSIASTDIKLHPEYWGRHYGIEIKRGLVNYLFSQTDCLAVQATPNVNNAASIKMQEAAGGIRTGEGIFTFPESMVEQTCPVHYLIYRIYRPNWQNRSDIDRS